MTSDESVQAAAKEYQQQYNNSHDETTTSSLYAIVNNAGIIAGGSPFDVLNVNVRGPKRVDDAFLKFLDPKLGRIVHISSGSASGFVSRVPEEKKKAYFTNKNITWEEIEGILREIEKEVDFAKGLNKTGLVADNTGTGGMVAYGLSKGLLNSYNQALSNSHPNLKINACTPGMVATDIASTFVPWWLPLPTFLIKAVMINFLNAKTPDEGTFSTMHLLFANDLKGNGRYYGSDVKRSPLDRYRSPGDPEYVSDDDEE